MVSIVFASTVFDPSALNNVIETLEKMLSVIGIPMLALTFTWLILELIDEAAPGKRASVPAQQRMDYLGEETAGVVSALEKRETALGTQIKRFEIKLDEHQDDPAIVVDEIGFDIDSLPEPGARIAFTHDHLKRRFDGARIHIKLKNWWAIDNS